MVSKDSNGQRVYTSHSGESFQLLEWNGVNNVPFKDITRSDGSQALVAVNPNTGKAYGGTGNDVYLVDLQPDGRRSTIAVNFQRDPTEFEIGENTNEGYDRVAILVDTDQAHLYDVSAPNENGFVTVTYNGSALDNIWGVEQVDIITDATDVDYL